MNSNIMQRYVRFYVGSSWMLLATWVCGIRGQMSRRHQAFKKADPASLQESEFWIQV
jgi:hypothetical protein